MQVQFNETFFRALKGVVQLIMIILLFIHSYISPISFFIHQKTDEGILNFIGCSFVHLIKIETA